MVDAMADVSQDSVTEEKVDAVSVLETEEKVDVASALEIEEKPLAAAVIALSEEAVLATVRKALEILLPVLSVRAMKT
jgi:hypothetical protein